MTVPSREEAARLLLSLDPPEWHLRHSRAVAEIAGWLALRVQQHTNGVDRHLVEAAALLHDVDKALPQASRGEGRHGEVGGRWLAAHGLPELAEVVGLHPVTRLVDADEAAKVFDASAEARIVAYADKRAAQRLQPMTERFGRWRRRHPEGTRGGWSADVAAATWSRAEELERQVCAMARCRPEDVRRLGWTGAAFTAARDA